MVTANLSRALQRTVTSVAVGKDIVSRTGSVTFERLLDQVGAPGAPFRMTVCEVGGARGTVLHGTHTDVCP